MDGPHIAGLPLKLTKDRPAAQASAAMLLELADHRMKIGSIVIHCHEYERMVAFWQSALRYIPREPARGGWVVLRDPEGKGPNLSFQARETRRPRRNWLHLDLYTDRQEEEVNRLLELGARRYPWRYRPGSDFVVLEDPDGNLFCVVQKETPRM